MSFAAWASLPLRTTAIGRDFFEVVVSPQLSVVSEEVVSALPGISAARLAV